MKGDADLGAERRAQEGIFLAVDLPTDGVHVDGDDLAGIGSGKGNVPFASAPVGEMGHEERFSGQGPLAGAQKLSHHSRIGLRSVSHLGLEQDIVFHVIHGSRFGDDGLIRVEFHLDHLHIIPDDVVIHLVTPHLFLLA